MAEDKKYQILREVAAGADQKKKEYLLGLVEFDYYDQKKFAEILDIPLETVKESARESSRRDALIKNLLKFSSEDRLAELLPKYISATTQELQIELLEFQRAAV